MPDPLPGPRLRQVALVAHDCEKTANALQETFGWPDPFHDPGVREFGLINAVFPVGGTPSWRWSPPSNPTPPPAVSRPSRIRQRLHGHIPDASLEETRRRVTDLEWRVVWKVDLDDIAGTHLHPKDIPGAIVSLDWASPTNSWRWAGPAWTGNGARSLGGRHRRHNGRGSKEPAETAQAWARFLVSTPKVTVG